MTKTTRNIVGTLIGALTLGAIALTFVEPLTIHERCAINEERGYEITEACQTIADAWNELNGVTQ